MNTRRLTYRCDLAWREPSPHVLGSTVPFGATIVRPNEGDAIATHVEHARGDWLPRAATRGQVGAVHEYAQDVDHLGNPTKGRAPYPTGRVVRDEVDLAPQSTIDYPAAGPDS